MSEKRETVDAEFTDQKASKDVKLIVFSALGFLGLDKFYQKRTDWGILKIVALMGIPLILSILSLIPLIGLIFAFSRFFYGPIALAWYVLDIVFASLGKYEINPLDYLRKKDGSNT